MPKTISHCKVYSGKHATIFRNPLPIISVFWGCGRLLHALNYTLQWLIVSTVFGTVSSVYNSYAHVRLTLAIEQYETSHAQGCTCICMHIDPPPNVPLIGEWRHYFSTLFCATHVLHTSAGLFDMDRQSSVATNDSIHQVASDSARVSFNFCFDISNALCGKYSIA